MAEFSPEHYDFVDQAETETEAVHNKVLLEANYLGKASLFRANVYEMLHKLDANGSSGFGWAIFMPPPSDDGMIAKEVLVLTGNYFTPVSKKHVPSVRIITNELYDVDGQRQWLTVDFTLDEDDDALYLVDALQSNTTDVDEREEVMDGKVNRGAASGSPIFWVDADGDLCMNKMYRPFTPLGDASGAGKEREALFPFGHWTRLHDNIDALEMGKQLFAEIKDLEPAIRRITKTES